jgi:hypothetical protein
VVRVGPEAARTADDRVRFVAQGAGYTFFFADAEGMLSFAPVADEVVGAAGSRWAFGSWARAL